MNVSISIAAPEVAPPHSLPESRIENDRSSRYYLVIPLDLYLMKLWRVGLGRTPKHGLAQIDQSLHNRGRHGEWWYLSGLRQGYGVLIRVAIAMEKVSHFLEWDVYNKFPQLSTMTSQQSGELRLNQEADGLQQPVERYYHATTSRHLLQQEILMKETGHDMCNLNGLLWYATKCMLQ